MERMTAISPRLACLVAMVGSLAMATSTVARAEAKGNTSVVNAGGADGAPMAARLRRVLDSRGKLAEQAEPIEAALEGRPVARPSFDDVRKAFSDFRYQDTDRLLEDLSDALLDSTSADAQKPLAEVLWWQGLVAAVDDREKPPEQRRRAKLYFTAAFALDAALGVDSAVTPPRVRLIMDESRRVQPEQGTLQIEVDAKGAELSVDGGPPAVISSELAVPTGLHLLRITAPARGAVLRLVEITKGSAVRLSIELPPEAKPDKVRRLVSETASLPEGKPRMKVLSRLSGVVGVQQLLLVESVASQRAKIRLYDVAGKRMSQQFSFAQSDSSSAVGAAVDGAFRLSEGEDLDRRWYQRWQVWAGVGGAVLLVAIVVNANKEPRIQGL
jgi:hypothetical protein